MLDNFRKTWQITVIVIPLHMLSPGIIGATGPSSSAIDRRALVNRHNITLTAPVSRSVLQVGNGEFAFGVDLTGLQTTMGNTMSQWGWHSFPLPKNQQPGDLRLQEYDLPGRKIGYATNQNGQEELFKWLRENPHRINLGRLRLLLDGVPVRLDKLKAVRQQLDLWRGLIVSSYELENKKVLVETCCHPTRDMIAVRIKSELMTSGRLSIELAFPYGDPGVSGGNWQKQESHDSKLQLSGLKGGQIERRLDGDRYRVTVGWSHAKPLHEIQPHTYLLEPSANSEELEMECAFSPLPDICPSQNFREVKKMAADHWKKFWNSGGAIDLSESKDPRWHELERRIVLSQYLLAVNEAGSLPPQESGLFNNGWNGKFHLEMHWWHGTHYALWNRWPLFERSLDWYFRTLPSAQQRAVNQGYSGARWPKMVGPDGADAPSGTGPLLAWQQPNPIFYALLDYRLHPTQDVLRKWQDVVFETARFMASYATPDEATGQFILGPPLKTVPENTNPINTKNPAFELGYWRFGLRVAQEWRAKLGLQPDQAWTKVLNGLSPLPIANGVYLQQEGMTDTYTQWNWEHPSLIGTLGMLPGDGVDPQVMKRTVKKVMTEWNWNKCWGWDFPMMAMAAARNGAPEMAIDALLNSSPRNGFNEIGLSSGGPFPYFPSNGGLLYAVAMMAAGWDGGPQYHAPGFPKDGNWVVKWEGLYKAP